MTDRTLRVGLLGCGNVGAAVIRLLHEHAEDIAMRAGCRLEVTRVAVRDLDRERDVPVPATAFTTDAGSIVDDPAIDIVCELLGGTEPARSLLLGAFAHGKSVVTANKELLANDGQALFEAADAAERDLYFEAAVAGGIPLIRPLKESLAGERVGRILGIVNGTTNFILTRMSDHGSSFADALAEAQRLGYAEADPTADVEGFDAAAKCAILASIAFNTRVVAGDVYREGITRVTPVDIADAKRMGYVVKLLAIAELEDDEVSARVHPAIDPGRPPPRERPRRLQRRLPGGTEDRSADVLRAWRGRGPHRDGGRGRPRHRGAARDRGEPGRRLHVQRSTGVSGRWTTPGGSTT